MKETIYIPKTIRVGYQNRSDTYTKKLAYVVYYDAKNVLRKESSWNTWRDKNIEPDDFANVPTSGFVLNKKVGDYRSDWNHRKAHIRVFDPRGFEFEISPENLLYILENSSSIKGKGIEDSCVYGWDGKDLILMPVSSPDYEKISEYSEMIGKKESVKSKDLILGATYRTNKNELWVYMGKFDKYETSTWNRKKLGECLGKSFYFRNGKVFETISSLSGRIIKVENEEFDENYATWMDELQCMPVFSPIDETKTLWVDADIENLRELCKDNRSYWSYKTRVWTKFEGVYYPLILMEEKDKGYYLIGDGNGVDRVGIADGLKRKVSRICYDYTYSSSDYMRFHYGNNAKHQPLEYLFENFDFKHRKRFLVNGKKYMQD